MNDDMTGLTESNQVFLGILTRVAAEFFCGVLPGWTA
jgi:hypothetical protein